MTISLPHSYLYDLYPGDVSLQCTYQMLGTSSFLYLPFCFRLGSRIKVVMNDNIPTNVFYRLRIYNVFNPIKEICFGNKILFGVATQDESRMLYRTPANSLNSYHYNYTGKGGLKTINVNYFDVASLTTRTI
jgi:hypothetical protein